MHDCLAHDRLRVRFAGSGEDLRAAQRLRIMRCMIATLAVSQGIPMLSHGDELGRTQRGNNNAYCQDGPLSWVDWDLSDAEAKDLLTFTRCAFGLRRSEPGLRRREHFHGRTLAEGPKDLSWIRPDGGELEGHLVFAVLGDRRGEQRLCLVVAPVLEEHAAPLHGVFGQVVVAELGVLVAVESGEGVLLLVLPPAGGHAAHEERQHQR